MIKNAKYLNNIIDKFLIVSYFYINLYGTFNIQVLQSCFLYGTWQLGDALKNLVVE